jgi:hypothetical protein
VEAATTFVRVIARRRPGALTLIRSSSAFMY